MKRVKVLYFGGIGISRDISLYDTITKEEATKRATIKGVCKPVNDFLEVAEIIDNFTLTIKRKRLEKWVLI